MSSIPGLKEIREETTPDGKTRIVFDISEDRSDEFFRQFGLEPGDEEGFNKIVVESIKNYLSFLEGKVKDEG
jgi:hypothetical protein